MAAPMTICDTSNIFKYIDPYEFLTTIDIINSEISNCVSKTQFIESVNLANLAIEAILSGTGPTEDRSCDDRTGVLGSTMRLYYDMVTETDDTYALHGDVFLKVTQLLIKYATTVEQTLLESLLEKILLTLNAKKEECCTDLQKLSIKKALHAVDEILTELERNEKIKMQAFIQNLENLAVYKIVNIDDGHWAEEEIIFFVIKIVPKLKTFSKSIHLQVFYEMQQKISSNCNSIYLAWYLSFVCLNIDDIMSSSKKELLFNKEFTKVLQRGVLGNNPVSRKRALFLLQKLQFQDSISMNDYWNNICLIVETLNEKQVHLVHAVYPKIESVISESLETTSSEKFSWLLVLFKLLFRHDSRIIASWGIKKFLNLPFNCEQLSCEEMQTLLGDSLFPCLNNHLLFDVLPGLQTKVPSSAECLVTFFRSSIQTLDTISDCRNFLQQSLKSMVEITWQSIPLIYILYSLSEVPSGEYFNRECLLSLKSLAEKLKCSTDKMHDEGVILVFKIIMKQASFQHMDLELFADFLLHLPRRNRDSSNSVIWQELISWAKNKYVADANILSASMMNFCFWNCTAVFGLFKNQCETSDDVSKPSICKLARVAVLLFEANCLSDCTSFSVDQFLSPIEEIAGCLNSRAYMPITKAQAVLQIITCLLDEAKISGWNADKKNSSFFGHCESLLMKCGSSILTYISMQLNSNESNPEMDLNLLVGFLDHLITYSDCVKTKLLPRVLTLVGSHITEIHQDLQKVHKASNVGTKVKVISWFLPYMSREMLTEHTEFFVSFLSSWKSIMNAANSMDKPLKGVEINNLLADIWTIIFHILKDNDQLSVSLGPEYDINASSALCQSSCQVSIIIVNSLRYFLSQPSMNMKVFEECLSAAWQTMMEHKRNEYFQPILQAIIKLLFHLPIISNQRYESLIYEHTLKILELGESTPGIFSFLVNHIETLHLSFRDSSDIPQSILQIILQALSFGPLSQKSQRIKTNTLMFVRNDVMQEFEENWHGDEIESKIVRSKAVRVMLSLCCHHPPLVNFFTFELVKKDLEINSLKKKYVSNSISHRTKLRIWQTLLCLQPFWTKETSSKMLDVVCEGLVNEIQQASTRYFQEWAAVLVLMSYTNLRDDFHVKLQEAAVKRTKSVGAFLSVMNHVIRHEQNPDQVEHILVLWMPTIVYWCLNHNFVVRLFALVVLNTIFDVCLNKNVKVVLDQYSMLLSACSVENNAGNTAKHMERIRREFYFKTFHPIKDHSLETIFYELPRLSHVTDEEWIPAALFDGEHNPSTLERLLVKNADNQLKLCVPSVWNPQEQEIAEDPIPTQHSDTVQKKIVSWKLPLMQSEVNINSLSREHILSLQKKEGLVVVASLIDKAPNLGGLCRTCEVFGVTEFIVDKLNITKEKDFINLSVTADRWIPINEVKISQLSNYLLKMKDDGFVVVGAEQSSNSVSLSDVKFPQKAVLLLGNEKEGIPVDLIQLLDMCIEIPQQGLIRSLNVHVSGALLIWEYSRQHHNNTS